LEGEEGGRLEFRQEEINIKVEGEKEDKRGRQRR
jgi:hypothetical protein